ncbi:SDR family NAD(P)-dependent oxidoreductase [Streptomyces sp. SID8379]|uniref:SDR family NAD(P)-dependent oxidoreductase n=1 Tax=unclassified Streptomyces TaxID=2593676 RepID=UPI000360A22F|nr:MULTISPECIES: SDR family NAD(P)-dependent oxidoreductase [unclassified Streptomyces]MYW66359.1 SDR family NAD(P)-dependent oxidoreductase [Streptomyces sp. SID8379]
MTTIAAQHRIGSGFGAHSTAAEVVAGIDLTGRTALVTGGYSGLGLETTRALVAAGAHVIVPARRPEAAREALSTVPRTAVDALDLSDLESVRSFADRFLDSGRTLDLVVNNAGVMAVPEQRAGRDWEFQFATNHLGHYALVNRLRPAFAPGGTRVVALTSSGHFLTGIRWDDPNFRTGYDRWLAYGQAKTANALFALHLDRLGAASGVRAYAVHPGSILTPLQRHIPREEWAGRGWITETGEPPAGFKTPQQGAATTLWAATSPLLDAREGAYGGAYCQDCDLAESVPDDADDMLVGGVKSWARDPEAAARLWTLSAELTGVDAFA